VRDPEAASTAMRRAGFAPTPLSVQSNPDGTPTGTGNVTAMFIRGYIEVLFKTADTALGREFDAALDGYSGVHLAACSVADAEGNHRRLSEAGFAMRPLVQFQRPVGTENGPAVAAFTVVRLERGAMAEGRIQLLAHRTEDTVWQKRWLSHENGALGLMALLVVSGDVAEATARFTRFTGRGARPMTFGQSITLDRGRIEIVTETAWMALVPEVPAPRLPFLAAYAIRVASLRDTEDLVDKAMLNPRRTGKTLVVPFPPELGTGAWFFAEQPSDLPWRA